MLDFFYRNEFLIELILAYAIFAFKIKKRKMFTLRVIVALIISLSFSNFVPLFVESFGSIGNTIYGMAWFLTMFAITLPLFCFCFEADIWTALFCGVGAYAAQHAFNRISIIFTYYLFHFAVEYMWLTHILNWLTFFFVYGLCFIGTKKLRGEKAVIINNKSLIATMLLLLLVTIVISFLGFHFVMLTPQLINTPIHAIISLYSCIVSYFAIDNLINNATNKKMQHDVEVLETLWKNSRKQYELSKQNIEALNIKHHDLKYYLSSVIKDEIAINEISQSLNIYNSILKTKNETLDVILAEKSMQCFNMGIKMACIANGELLKDMHAVDIYTLFGNAIDNAIECLQNVKNEEKRVINVFVRRRGSMVNIQFENYTPMSVDIENGLPRTTKDTLHHGFGLKSIRHIVEKYSGNMRTTSMEDVFTLNIVIPI